MALLRLLGAQLHDVTPSHAASPASAFFSIRVEDSPDQTALF